MKINGVTRADILKRAWQLRRRGRYGEFGPCLSMAWSEAKSGYFHDWVHLPIRIRYEEPEKHLEGLKKARMCLDMKDRWNQDDYAQIRAYDNEISQIERALVDV
jgi:hypothetical protein